MVKSDLSAHPLDLDEDAKKTAKAKSPALPAS
jgi:hypothetical protein